MSVEREDILREWYLDPYVCHTDLLRERGLEALDAVAHYRDALARERDRHDADGKALVAITSALQQVAGWLTRRSLTHESRIEHALDVVLAALKRAR